MKEKQAKDYEKAYSIVLILLILIVGSVYIYVNLVNYKSGLNSDVAAEGLLAKVIWESKEWIPEEWYYSTESKVLSVANIASIFYGITQDICLAMGISCIIGCIFIIGNAWYLGKALDFSLTEKLLFVFLTMMLPNNRIQLDLLYTVAGYYAIHMGVYLGTLAIYTKILKKKEIRKLEIIINLVLHFIMGMQGVRGILIITGPLMAVEILRRISLWWSRNDKGRNNVITGFILVLNIIEFLGGRIPLSVGQSMSRNIRKAPEKLIKNVFPDFLNTFNWMHLSTVEKVIYTIFIGAVLYLVWDIIIKCFKKEIIAEDRWIFMNLFVSVILTMAALVFTTIASSSRYFIVIYFAIAMGIILLMDKKRGSIQFALMFISCVLWVINCHNLYYPMVADRSYEQHVYRQIGQYLIEEDYEYAYTDFYNANVITVHSDGKIQVSAVDSFEDMKISKWLTSKKWYVPNVPAESKTAYIVPSDRMEQMEEFLRNHQGEVEYKTEIDDFYIYASDYNYSKLTN